MPQPIDMQTELGRTIMAERVQEAVGRTSLAAQARSLQESDEDRLENETLVHETHETENRRLDEDARRKNPFVGKRRRRKRPTDQREKASKVFYTPKEGEEIAEDPDDHRLDVTI